MAPAGAPRRPGQRRARVPAAVSRDGSTWFWGGVWTLHAGANPRIGLLAHGAQGADTPDLTATFDYLKIYTGGSWNL